MWAHLWTQEGPPSYPQHMSTPEQPEVNENSGKEIRRVRVPDETWDAYTEATGDLGRASDLRGYMEWRSENPTTPLPGKKRGPIRRWRSATRERRIADGLPV